MSLCVSLHTLYYVPSYTLQGAWLLLGVRGSNVQKKTRPSAHSQKVCNAYDAFMVELRPRLRHLNTKTNSKHEANNQT